MASLRSLLSAHRGAFALLMAVTLAVKLVVPTGFMPMAVGGTTVMAICSGVAMDHDVAMSGMVMTGSAHHADDHGARGTAAQPCAFADLALPTLEAIAPMLLAAALVFAFLLAMRVVVTVSPLCAARLRPPLRAPPLRA